MTDPIYPKQYFASTRLSRTGPCFVLMPFSDDLVVVYKRIKQACEDEGYECQRSDDINKTGPVLVHIMEGIRTARVVIADLSGLNANVFYELGMAHVVKDEVILLTQDLKNVPFDLRHSRCISYKNDSPGRGRLVHDIRQALRSLPPLPEPWQPPGPIKVWGG